MSEVDTVAPTALTAMDDAAVADVEPQALVATFSFDSGDGSRPYDATVRLSVRRATGSGAARRGDTLTQDELVHDVIPGTGTVSLTAWVYNVTEGEWEIDARLLRAGQDEASPSAPFAAGVPLQRATWSWRRWALTAAPPGPVRTRWALLAPLAPQPAVIPGIYTALAVVGFVVALTIQAALVGRAGVPLGPVLGASVLGLVVGLIGAKMWYAILNPERSLVRGGWAVDGFLVVAPLVAALMLYASSQPIGGVLDAAAPGIYFAVALGRIGCFLTGCCAGRCTASRWGIWSSDRRMGARRIPTQLLESVAGLMLGVATLVLLLGDMVPIEGATFVAAFLIYAIVRQGLLRLRVERRRESRTVPLTAAAAGVVAIVIAALIVAQKG